MGQSYEVPDKKIEKRKNILFFFRKKLPLQSICEKYKK
jgi:hypothetical protein